MGDTSAELRSTSDLLLLDLEALNDLEALKRATPHDDPKLVDLASRIEEIAHRLLTGSRRQRELTETITEAAEAGAARAGVTIDTMRSMAAILADWREAERATRDAPPGSRERIEAEAMSERFRSEYREAFEAARHEVE